MVLVWRDRSQRLVRVLTSTHCAFVTVMMILQAAYHHMHQHHTQQMQHVSPVCKASFVTCMRDPVPDSFHSF